MLLELDLRSVGTRERRMPMCDLDFRIFHLDVNPGLLPLTVTHGVLELVFTRSSANGV